MFTNLDILRKSAVVILPLRLGIRSTHVASGAGRQTTQFSLVVCKYRNSFRLQRRGFNKTWRWLYLAIKEALLEDNDWTMGSSACKCSMRVCPKAAHNRSPCGIVMVDMTCITELSRRIIYACKSINNRNLFV